MWPFKKSKSLKESGMLVGLTDWHSHVLPGVDDGSRKVEESLEILSAYEQLGVKKLWLTPHIMEDYPNETEDLKKRFAELKEAWKGKVELRLASENMLDSLFEKRLQDNDFLPIGEDGRHLLVETSYFNPPYGMDEMLEGIYSAGYTPLLAHPERYRYMDKPDYERLKEMGVMFQMNYLSLVGGYGETARKKAEWMLSKDMIDLVGSDVHRLRMVNDFIEKTPHSKSLESLLKVTANPAID